MRDRGDDKQDTDISENEVYDNYIGVYVDQPLEGNTIFGNDLHNNEMGLFFLDEGFAAEVHAGFDQLKSISYRWGSPEWFEMRKAVMNLKGMKGSSTRRQAGFYNTFKKTGFIWWL